MILFHLADCGGRAVADDLLVELVNIQTEVREYFGWEYQEDVKSAAAMSKFFTSDPHQLRPCLEEVTLLLKH